MSRDSRAFEGLLDGYFEGVLHAHPVFANYCGLRSGEGRLGQASPEFEASQHRVRVKTLKSLDAINPASLSPEQHLDRLALRSQLQRECEDFDRGRHRLDPSAVDGLLSLLLHELQRSEDEPRRAADNLRSVLRQTPRYLDESLQLLKRPEPVWARILEQTMEGLPSLFDAVRTTLGRIQPGQQDSSLIESAIRACRRYAAKALALQPAPAGSFAIGAEALSRRVRDQLGLDLSLGEIESLANGEAQRLGELLLQECRRFGRNKTAEEIIVEAREQWDPGADMLSVYRKETSRVAEAFREKEAVTFPRDETLEVRIVPEFMRHL
ncbi:MAG: DUF885 domain-containing protein, partial [Verrucomicrobia bacterium]|nr:DUF885 domain-containing protein [Verrucomicrobiota bacterium]